MCIYSKKKIKHTLLCFDLEEKKSDNKYKQNTERWDEMNETIRHQLVPNKIARIYVNNLIF